jgi:outer membrane murein-binding lipoprotein Lpp
MPESELERLAETVDRLVEELKAARSDRQNVSSDKRKLEEKVAQLEKQLRQLQKEGEHTSELLAQNKAYKKKHALLKSKVVSMLAKVEAMQ